MWRLHRRNKTSGKSVGGVVAENLTEYVAKTMANDGNAGSFAFHYTPIDPSGQRWKLFGYTPEHGGEWRAVDWAGREIEGIAAQP